MKCFWQKDKKEPGAFGETAKDKERLLKRPLTRTRGMRQERWARQNTQNRRLCPGTQAWL